MKYAGLLIVGLLTSVGCERPFLEPWPPDGARTPKEIFEFYAFSRGILFRVMGEHQFSYNLYSMTGPAMLATATDEAEHTLSQNLIQSINDGSWGPARSVDSRYGGTISHWVRSPWYNSYMGIRKVNLLLDDLDNSERMYREALDIINESDNQLGKAYCYAGLGRVYGDKGDLAKAKEFAEKSFEIYKGLDYKEGMAYWYWNFGGVYLKSGELEPAEDLFGKGLVISKEMECKESMAYHYEGLGEVYLKMAQTSRAKENLQNAMELFEQLEVVIKVEKIQGQLKELK